MPGFIYVIQGEWEKSEQYLQEALSISQKLKDFQTIAWFHAVLGRLHSEKGENVKAREFFEKAYEVYEKVGVKRMGEIVHTFALKVQNKRLTTFAIYISTFSTLPTENTSFNSGGCFFCETR